jgi:hypothetical protein
VEKDIKNEGLGTAEGKLDVSEWLDLLVSSLHLSVEVFVIHIFAMANCKKNKLSSLLFVFRLI